MPCAECDHCNQWKSAASVSTDTAVNCGTAQEFDTLRRVYVCVCVCLCVRFIEALVGSFGSNLPSQSRLLHCFVFPFYFLFFVFLLAVASSQELTQCLVHFILFLIALLLIIFFAFFILGFAPLI